MQVFPFGYLRVSACLQLVVAFRSLPRPSSALSAKASTVCPYSLDLLSSILMAGPSSSLFRNSRFSVRNCFLLLFQKNFFHYTLCSFQRPSFEFTLSSSLKIKQLIAPSSPDVDYCPLEQLLRKEVIQPHLPIRLPCYDFTPIIDSTFDCCLLR